MLLSVASSMQHRIEGRQPSEPVRGGEKMSAASQAAAQPVGAWGRRTAHHDGVVSLASPAAISNGLKDLLTMQEEEQQSLWSLDAALQACITV